MPMRVMLHTLALAMKREVADTPTGVVMIGWSGNSCGTNARSLKTIKEEHSWRKKKRSVFA